MHVSNDRAASLRSSRTRASARLGPPAGLALKFHCSMVTRPGLPFLTYRIINSRSSRTSRPFKGTSHDLTMILSFDTWSVGWESLVQLSLICIRQALRARFLAASRASCVTHTGCVGWIVILLLHSIFFFSRAFTTFSVLGSTRLVSVADFSVQRTFPSLHCPKINIRPKRTARKAASYCICIS